MSENEDPNEALADEWAAALEESGDAPASNEAETVTQPASFNELSDDSTHIESDLNVQSILDVPVTISMEIGRTRINIRNLLQLTQGSVIELDRIAGEPMDVLVNGTLIAQGEVVVVNEKFGIRLTDVVSPADRVKRING